MARSTTARTIVNCIAAIGIALTLLLSAGAPLDVGGRRTTATPTPTPTQVAP
jgi:hypothetical protein